MYTQAGHHPLAISNRYHLIHFFSYNYSTVIWKYRKEKEHLRDQDVDERVILQTILRQLCEINDPSCSAYGLVTEYPRWGTKLLVGLLAS